MAPWELALSVGVGVAFVGLFVGVSMRNARRRRRMERAWRRYASDNGFEMVELPVSERLAGTGPRFALERLVGDVAVRIEHVAATGGEGSSSGANPALIRVSGMVWRALPPDLWLHASPSTLPYSIPRVTTGEPTVDQALVVQAEPPDAV